MLYRTMATGLRHPINFGMLCHSFRSSIAACRMLNSFVASGENYPAKRYQSKHRFHFSCRAHSNASKNQSNPPERALGLPNLELPPPIPHISRTTALLTKPEAVNYLYPLYCRGWVIKSMVPNDGFNDPDRKSPFLVGKFTVKGPKSARQLLRDLLSIEDQEKQHVSFELWSGKRPVITVTTQTHSARKSPELEAVNSTEPGITLRDIRFAVLLEKVVENTNILFSGQESQNSSDIVQSSTWKELLSQYPWK
ncbi:hypothetical protein CPB84DRAFT_1782794 [Gymnopilus junonius]|uniref:Uncharacterized protein n=1 Tax=Gymnopilus junonius TaxID=109634 RepID=A0A9P5TME9_GYMJU|nr:hypothetical protein CPB84DRAFT_1782794 [Gymnopilus junonius]